MSTSRVTMKDIAAKLGVSVNTVHKAVTGKPGVSETQRERILACAEEMGYHRNAAASNLRRKEVHVIACLPSPEREGSYFYSYLWRGCEHFAAETRDMGLSIENLAFAPGGYASALEAIDARLQAGEHIDGLLAYVPTDDRTCELLTQIANAGVTVELVDGDKAQVPRLGASISDYTTAGRIMAEQALNLMRFAPEGSRVLLLAGDPHTDSHHLTARALHERLAEAGAPFAVEELIGAHGQVDELTRAVCSRLTGEDSPKLICSVFAVGSEIAGDALVGTGRAGEVMVIGNDLFPESALAIERGIFTNIVYKDAAGLAYRAAKTLGDFLLWGTTPAEPVQKGSVELIFASNLAHYRALAGI